MQSLSPNLPPDTQREMLRRMLTIRRDDLRAIAAAAGIDVDALVHRLDDLQLRRA